MYALIRPLLFLFDAEKVHHFIFRLLRFLFSLPGGFSILKLLYGKRGPAAELFGLKFPGRVGLAAGFDKDAYLNEKWEALGFGFMEIGTVTPRPQPGNPKPRLFRLPKDKAILNRMGFNSGGLDAMLVRLKKIKSRGLIIGGNIGKNKDTPNEKALDDYLICFEKLYPFVDYFTVNVSSPNTPGLRELQEKEPLRQLLAGIMHKNRGMASPKPILLKIAPDLSESQLDDIVEIVKSTGISGIVATNTTLSREGLTTPKAKVEALGAGGLSGAPLKHKSLEIIRQLHQKTEGKIPIIGVGGIMSPQDAKAMLDAGASLIQVYSGFIYGGPAWVKRLGV